MSKKTGLKFVGKLIKPQGGFISSFLRNYKKYLLSGPAYRIYIMLAGILIFSLFIAASISRYLSSEILISTLKNINIAETSGPSPTKKSGINAYSSILKYNLPDSTINGGLTSYASTGRLLLSSMNLDLVGTIRGAINYAFFINKSNGNKEIFVKQGDTIKPGLLLQSVHSKYIVVESGPTKSVIKIGDNSSDISGGSDSGPQLATSGPPVSTAAGNGIPNYANLVKKTGDYSYEINRSGINKKQLNKIFTQMQAVPNFVGGKIKGFKILNMMPTGIFSYMGLQTGDVIENIDGTPLKNPQETMNLLSGLLYQKSISIGIRRSGSNITMNYSIN